MRIVGQGRLLQLESTYLNKKKSPYLLSKQVINNFL